MFSLSSVPDPRIWLWGGSHTMAAEASSTGFLLSLFRAWEWQWHWLLYVIVIWEAKRIFELFFLVPVSPHTIKPQGGYSLHPHSSTDSNTKSNVRITGPSTIFGHWVAGFKHVFYLEEVASNAYKMPVGKIWAMPTRNNFHICVPTKEYIEEFDRAPQNELSLRGVSHELFPPHELFGGLPPESPGIFQKILKTDMRQCLPQLEPSLQDRLHEAFKKDFCGKKNPEGKHDPLKPQFLDLGCIFYSRRWTKVTLSSTMFKMIARVNSLAILGPDLSKTLFDSGTVTRYLKTATLTGQLLGILPRFMKPLVGKLIMRYIGGLDEMVKQISNEISLRVKPAKVDGPEHMDCIQWTIGRSRKESVLTLTPHILGILFASTHQPPMLLSYAIYRLCLHPEYLQPLQDEARLCAKKDSPYTNSDDMPLMDSFLKEVSRVHPITVVTLPHKVEKAFTFSDGTYIPAGNWVCVPQQAILNDPNIYNDPETFQPFRFVQWENENGVSPTPSSESRFSHPSWKYPYWGTLKQAW
ncbi:cytochrome P450 [Sclerotinia borealis F-4128]|uniref:Cytochrome P450 n=1 Tax=Sclerotinia borealis (strain F-4128) TaxID=1432307 RepID=W9C8X7_SCLBF|nr:cytochrome P450 [Sclerotinia borealis F-4128]